MKPNALVCLLFSIIFCLAGPARSEDITSKQVDVAASQVAGNHPEFLARSAPKTFQQRLVDNFRQSMMGEHHREGPPLPPGPLRKLGITTNAPTASPRELDLMAAHVAAMATSNPHPATAPTPIIRQVKILSDHTLADTETAAATSTICEPSIAFRRDTEVLITGN